MAPELLDEVFPLEEELPLAEGLALLLEESDLEGIKEEELRELEAGLLTPDEGGDEEGDEDGDEDGGTELDEKRLMLLLPPSPTTVPVPQGMSAPLGWTLLEGGTVAPLASAMAKRVVQYVVFEVGSLNW